jgi:nicotinate-nucleotide pyrophosphorylase (carboxylating)
MANPVSLPSPAEISPVELQRIIDTALSEDLASGDVTTRSVVPPDSHAEGTFGAREALVVCGLGVVLTGERVALNLFQRMSGVASRTRTFVDAVPGESPTRITDTRKTTPGLRALERYAVRCGGGVNHRNDLGSGVLIKDNHIVLCGGVRPAIERARAACPHPLRIEVEVDSLAMLDEAVGARADIIMLDNFDDDMCREAMTRLRGLSPRPLIEISGGLSLERIPQLAALGVDVLSVGSLTHGFRSMDIGLDLSIRGQWKT